VAREIIDALVATKKHEILVLTRRDAPPSDTATGVSYAKTDYTSTSELVSLLKGTHTVLSFFAAHQDQAEAADAQKRLIDASITTGVKRFAPSEWFSTKLDHMPWYSFKGETRKYLQEINKDKKVLEYSLFQPGMFTDYLARPYMTTKHVQSLETPFDFQNKRMLVREGGEGDVFSFTTVKDLASVVAKAVEYEGVWPVVGGIRGSSISVAQLIEFGQKVRGKFTSILQWYSVVRACADQCYVGEDFDITRIPIEGLEAGNWTSSWVPILHHPSLPPDHIEAVSRVFVAGLLLAAKEGALDTSDEWNKLLPDHGFEAAEKVWKAAFAGKP
ncbi:hypothetical protein N0V95_004852, partial [Ascochyta clinopodiicola]